MRFTKAVWTKNIITVCLALLSTAGTYGEDAYVMLNVVLHPLEKKQPTWIGLNRTSKAIGVHVSAQKAIQSVEPGTYRIVHVDFSKHERSGINTSYLKGAKDYQAKDWEFKFAPNTITFVGMLTLRETSNVATRVELIPDTKMLKQACESNPDLFARVRKGSWRRWRGSLQRFVRWLHSDHRVPGSSVSQLARIPHQNPYRRRSPVPVRGVL